MTLWDQKETLSPDTLLQNCLCQLYLNCDFCDARFLLFFFFCPSWKKVYFNEGNEFAEGSVCHDEAGGRKNMSWKKF